jgi:WD40 repeat protein
MSQASVAFEFKAVVKSDPARLLKGQLKCGVTAEGLRLQQGKKLDLLLPVGTFASGGDGGRFRVQVGGREVELAVASWALYPQRLARDLCAFLGGQRPPLAQQDYAIPPYLYVPAVLPLGIPALTRGGALWGALGFGLAGGCLAIIRREQWPAAARVASALGLSAAGYAVVIALLFLVMKPAWLVENKPEIPSPAAEPVQGMLGPVDTWKADVDPATGKLTIDTWNDRKGATTYNLLPGMEQDNLYQTSAPKKLPGEPLVLTHADVPITRLAFAPDSKTLATLDGRNYCRMWDTTTGKELVGFTVGRSAGWFAFSPDSEHLMAWDGSGPAALRRTATGQEVRRLDMGGLGTGGGTWNSDCDFSPDGKLFAGQRDGKIRFWRMPNFDPVDFPHVSTGFDKPKRVLQFLRFGLDSKTLITTSAGEDGHGPGVLRRYEEVWNLEKPESPRLLTSFKDENSTNALHLSLDRKLVLSTNGQIAEVVDWATDRTITRLDGSRQTIKSMATTTDGLTLITGHGAATGPSAVNLSLWDLRRLKLLGSFLCAASSPAPVADAWVAVSADGRLLAIALANSVNIWKLEAISTAK